MTTRCSTWCAGRRQARAARRRPDRRPATSATTSWRAHGGSRRSVEVCVICHTPQTTEPNTGNTVDIKVMVHKIHMGSQLPSVKAGKPYQIGGGANPSDWSTVVFPADPRRCESCHDPEVRRGAGRRLPAAIRAARPAAPATTTSTSPPARITSTCRRSTDNQCATCHIPQGELEFDASIKGAHTIPQRVRNQAGHRVRHRQGG